MGTFDHSAKTADEIAKYACGKLGLKGHTETALRIHANSINNVKVVKTEDKKAASSLEAGVFE